MRSWGAQGDSGGPVAFWSPRIRRYRGYPSAEWTMSTIGTDIAMMFVDGSNLLVELADVLRVPERAEKPSNQFLSLAAQIAFRCGFDTDTGTLGRVRMLRRYWFGAMEGADEVLNERRDLLRAAGFEPVIFQKLKSGREKGVDLAIAREMLIQGFNRNYRAALLVAGDADYVGLVSDLKRMGLVVYGAFYDTAALSPDLRRSFDNWFRLLHPLQVNTTLHQEILDKYGPRVSG